MEISSNGSEMTGSSGHHFNNNLYTTKLVIPPVHQDTQWTSQLNTDDWILKAPALLPLRLTDDHRPPVLCSFPIIFHLRRHQDLDSLVRFSFN